MSRVGNSSRLELAVLLREDAQALDLLMIQLKAVKRLILSELGRNIGTGISVTFLQDYSQELLKLSSRLDGMKTICQGVSWPEKRSAGMS